MCDFTEQTTYIAELRAMRAKFDAKYICDPNSGCYLWNGTLDKNGYGRFSINHKWNKAHRYSWELYNGAIPQGMHICHRCDTPACVNPGHLFLGTNADNTADKTKKGRVPQGERHWSARLSEADITNIRADKRNHREIAHSYGVSKSHIQRIKNGSAWRHLLNSPATEPALPPVDHPLDRAVAGDSLPVAGASA